MTKTIEGAIHKPQKAAFEVEGITLLSVEEAEALPREIRDIDCLWWLRSPGHCQYSAANVSYDGSVYYCGLNVSSVYGAVRPALKIGNLKSLNLTFRDKVGVFGLDWTVIGDETVLCDTHIGKTAFREDWKAPDANDYEASDVKKFLDEWFKRQMEK